MTDESLQEDMSPRDEQASETPPPVYDGGDAEEATPDAESVDPLSAMAAGLDLSEADPYLEPPTEPVPFIEQAPRPTATVSSSAVASKAAAGRARAEAAQAAAAAIQLKQFMIPLLAAVGVLLVGIGVIPWVHDPFKPAAGADFSQPSNAPAWRDTMMNVVKFVAVPLGLLLLIGAAYFRMEVRRALRNKR